MARSLAPFASDREIALAAALDAADAAALSGPGIITASTAAITNANLGTVILTGPIEFGVTDTITAKASGTHATGKALTTTVNRLSVVATDADSVILPAMAAGQLTAIINSGTKSAQVFAAGTGTINAAATDTGVALASGKTGLYIAVTGSTVFGGALA